MSGKEELELLIQTCRVELDEPLGVCRTTAALTTRPPYCERAPHG